MWTKKVDKEILILHVLFDLYQKNNKTEFRYTQLKELCNDHLNAFTNGEQEDYGGSFERYLENLENKGLVKRLKEKKHTLIISNIPKIEYVIGQEKLNQSFDALDKRKIEEINLEDSIWEQIVEETFRVALDEIIKLRFRISKKFLQEGSVAQSHFVMKDVVSKIMANILSRSFEFNISYHIDKSTSPPIDRQVFVSLIEPFIKLVAKNKPNPCKITMEYNGIPSSHEAMKVFGPGLNKIITEYFVKWTSTVFNYHIDQEDKRRLEQGQHLLLGESASQYYAIFSRTLGEYLTYIQSA
jgi:hypothetical protein